MNPKPPIVSSGKRPPKPAPVATDAPSGAEPAAAGTATVDAAPRKLRGLVNAVLRRVAEGSRTWPDDATRLSYPDWLIEQLRADLGAADATAALEAMNVAATVNERDDGYTQDLAS